MTRRELLVSGATVIGTAGAALAKDLGYGTVVGRVTNTSSRLTGRKIFVQAGDQKWALHLGNTETIIHDGVPVSVHDIDVGTYVKAVGKRIGELRLDVVRLDIAGDRAAFKKAACYRKSHPEGYFQPGFSR
jgi:hypothetical protein